MNNSRVSRLALCGLVLSLASCQVISTEDSENTLGRGSKAFDPYAASASGAIKLGLQMFNGCAMLANGQPVAKGNSPIPDYPAKCSNVLEMDHTHAPKITPTGRFLLMTDTSYFLNQITLIDSVVNVHKDPNDLTALTRWMRTESRFSSLDWGNLGQQTVRWAASALPNSWYRETVFNNANWMTQKDDTFHLEVLDADGTVRQDITYSRKDFLAQSPVTGHTMVGQILENVLPPRTPDDMELRPAGDPFPGYTDVYFRSMIRFEIMGSTNPFKSFKIQGVNGDGAIRLTWSQMPDKPFYFPVTFVKQADVPPNCFKPDDDSPTPCGFGVDPRVKFSSPANGKFYVPGETFDATMDIRDGDGNRLHSANEFQSYADFYSGKGNGIMYTFEGHFSSLFERDGSSAFQVIGPLQDLKTWGDVGASPQPFYTAGGVANISFAPEQALFPVISGLTDKRWPTRFPITLPMNAKPGTYALAVRVSRQFMGERTTKGHVFFFQVGQEEKTTYPGQVGNCQICHRGVLSLDNVRHGFSVDHIEVCKGCHMGPSDHPGRIQEELHMVHMNSPKYSEDKANCSVCHLTRQSAVRPSMSVCGSCHASVHGDEYFQQKYANAGSPSRFSNCAQSCHVLKTPTNHILPQ